MALIKEAQERTIGSTQFKVFPLGARQGCQVMTRLTRLIGGALKGNTLDIKSVDVGSMISGALEAMQDSDLEFLCTTFAAKTTFSVDGTAWPLLTSQFETYFSANYGELFEWLKFCLEVNFSSFFETAKAAIATKPTIPIQAADHP